MARLVSRKRRVERLEVVMKTLAAHLPKPHCELFYTTPYQLLVSVVLSAKVTDAMVNRVMTPQYRQGFTPETVLSLGIDGFLHRIKMIGLAPTKAKNVYNLSRILLDRFAGEVPSEREDLESLPGVGRKTANVVLGEIFGQPILAVDTHVYRVTRRLGLQDEATPEKAEKELLKIMDARYLMGGHRYFIMHGRATCKALKPLCEICCLKTICPSYPALRPKPAPLRKAKT